jgi:hypothetical protein
MRLFSITLVGLMGFAAIATLAGCTPPGAATAPVAQACPAGVPWVDAGYANGKWVPAHCQGYAAQ